MIVSEVTLLPQPDSPTIPRVWFVIDREGDAVDGLDDAVVGLEAGAKVANLEEGHQVSRILGSNQA